MNPSEFPVAEGWSETTLGQVATVVGGGTPDAKNSANFCVDGGFPWITPADLSGFSSLYISRGARNLTERGLARSSARLLPAGTVLMSSRAPIGYVAIAANPIATNQGFKSFILPKQIEPRFLLYWLDLIKPLLDEMGSGSTFAELSGAKAKEIPFRLAPLAEQRRIVEKVEALLARVSTARGRLERVPRLLERFRQAVLAAACEGRLTEGWRTVRGMPEWVPSTLRSVVTYLDQGWSPRCKIQPAASDKTWGVIRTTAVQSMMFVPEENKALPENLEPRQGLEIKGGDLLITRAGPRARAGISCLVRSTRPRLMICDKVYRFRVDGEQTDPGFVEIQLNTTQMGATIDGLKTGISDSGVNLTQDKFLDLEIVLPHLSEQQEITLRVHALFSLADAIEHRVAAALALTAKLPQAILSRAFAGELVSAEAELALTEGRSYETANELLARVRQEREASGNRPEARGRKGTTGRCARGRRVRSG